MCRGTCRYLPACAAILAMVFPGIAGCRFITVSSGPTAWRLSRSRDLAEEAAAAWSAGDAQRAEAQYRRALRACPENDDARLRLCELLTERGELEGAMDCLRAHPSCSPAILERMLELQERQGRIDEAADTALQLLELDPSSHCALARLARDAEAKGNLTAALSYYHQLLAKEPGNTEARLALVQLYLRRGEPQRALATATDIARDYPPGEAPQGVFVARGLAYAAAGDLLEAERHLSEAMRHGPPSAFLLGQLARVEAQLGRLDRARDYLGRAERLSPNDPAVVTARRELSGIPPLAR